MTNARLFEFGLVGGVLLLLALAIYVGMQISVAAGLLVLIITCLGFLSLVYNFDFPLVRRLRHADDEVILNLCRTGFVGRARRIMSGLPSEPRCRFCFVPFGGIGKIIGIRPSAKNPNYCRSCFEGLPTETHEMKVGVLFADIRGFTSYSETHATGDAAQALTRFYAIANEVLTTDDAFVEFVGDQVMALYLVEMPSLGERTGEVMLAAAKRLVNAVAQAEQAEEVLPVGVGLNFGLAQVGPVEKGEAKDFTAIGDVVNTAARLQSTAGEYQIVLSDSVYNEFADGVPEAKPTTLEVKGKGQALEAYLIEQPLSK